ncbi:uncharacterized protein TNCV_189321 [Trichonephila clavipes]|nr:uncharacterized protein TNCV_189321 [Trichonephila clavipes]
MQASLFLGLSPLALILPIPQELEPNQKGGPACPRSQEGKKQPIKDQPHRFRDRLQQSFSGWSLRLSEGVSRPHLMTSEQITCASTLRDGGKRKERVVQSLARSQEQSSGDDHVQSDRLAGCAKGVQEWLSKIVSPDGFGSTRSGVKVEETHGNIFFINGELALGFWDGLQNTYLDGIVASLSCCAVRLAVVEDMDSLQSIVSLHSSSHPILVDITYALANHLKKKDIRFCWIPGHARITGNELADTAARSATGSSERFPIPHSDLKACFRLKLQSVWQSNWDQQTENKLHSIMPILAPTAPSLSNRREQVIWTRLRLGHTRLTHRHLLLGEPPPYCE